MTGWLCGASPIANFGQTLKEGFTMTINGITILRRRIEMASHN